MKEKELERSPNTILDFGFWIVKALPVGSFTNSNVARLNPNGYNVLLAPEWRLASGYTLPLPRAIAFRRQTTELTRQPEMNTLKFLAEEAVHRLRELSQSEVPEPPEHF